MKKAVLKQRRLRFDEIDALVQEITEETAEEYYRLPLPERRRRKELFWDSLLDFMIDGFAAGLLFIGEDKDFPEHYRFLDITYPNGETVSQIYDKDVPHREKFRRMIEAESNRCWNTGLMEAGRGAEGLMKTWETMEDNRVRDSHEILEGVTIPYDDEFITFGGDSALAPGMFEEAQHNVNCRCWLSLHKR